MSEHTSPQPADRLEAYLDGLLDDSERRIFEQAIENDPDLRAQVEAHRRAEAAIKLVFEPPSQANISVATDRILTEDAAANNGRSLNDASGTVSPSPSPSSSESNAPPVSTWHRFATTPIGGGRWVLAAAMLLFVASIALVTWRALQPAPPRWGTGYQEEVIHGEMIEVYDQLIASGFTPLWECPPPLFHATLAGRFGQGVDMGEFPADVQALGLSYADSLSRATLILLARVDNRPVVVFIDRAENARHLADDVSDDLPDGKRLHTHRKTVGDIVLIELSPLDQPYMLPSLELPRAK